MSDEGREEAAAGASARRRRPRLLAYLVLNLAVWGFLAIQAWLLTLALGSPRMILLFTALLALGFTAASIFDFCWIAFGRSGDADPSED